MDKATLKELIGLDKTSVVLDYLKKVSAIKNENKLAENLVGIQAEYYQILSHKIQGVLSTEEELRMMSKIRSKLYLFIDEMLKESDVSLELPASKEEIIKRDSNSFIDIHQRYDDVFDAPFYDKMNYYLNKAEYAIYITGGGLSNACTEEIMDNYLDPYRRLLDKGEEKRLFRLQYHDRLIYEKSGAWHKSLRSEKLEGFIKEYEGHTGLHICVDEKLHYPLHCFVIDPYSKNAIVEFYLPAAKGNGGNAIFLYGNVNEKRDLAIGLTDSLVKQMSSMQKINTANEFSAYIEQLLAAKTK